MQSIATHSGPYQCRRQSIEAPNLASESEEKEAATIASRAATARATGDERQAEMLENEVLTKFPGSLAAVDILIVRARAMVNSGDQAGALDLYRRALFSAPTTRILIPLEQNTQKS